MDLFDNISRAYLAIRVTPRIGEQLGQAQRGIYETAASEDRKVQSLPKDALTIPIIDLGEIKRPALEATLLGLTRALGTWTPFPVTLGTIEAWPDSTQPQLIQVTIQEGEERLRQLRQELAEQLEQYGFEVRQGTWQARVPISRIRGDGPELTVPTIEWTEGIEVESISVLVRREDRRGRMRFFVDGEVPFSSNSVDGNQVIDEESIRGEIRAQLEERLQQRGSQVRPARRRLRVKDIEDTIDVDADADEVDARA